MKTKAALVLFSFSIIVMQGISYAKKEVYTPPVTQSGFPEVTLPKTDIKASKNWLMNNLADYGLFLSKEGENILTFESEQKPIKFGQAMGMAFFESGVTNSMSNNKYLDRVNCSLIPASDTGTRVILRVFEVVSPGTPAERVYEVSKARKSQQTYFQLLSNMEQKLNIQPVEKVTGQVLGKGTEVLSPEEAVTENQ